MTLGVKGPEAFANTHAQDSARNSRAVLCAFDSGNFKIGRTSCFLSPGRTPGRESFSFLDSVAGVLPVFFLVFLWKNSDSWKENQRSAVIILVLGKS